MDFTEELTALKSAFIANHWYHRKEATTVLEQGWDPEAIILVKDEAPWQYYIVIKPNLDYPVGFFESRFFLMSCKLLSNNPLLKDSFTQDLDIRLMHKSADICKWCEDWVIRIEQGMNLHKRI